jgi:hypothetical protein
MKMNIIKSIDNKMFASIFICLLVLIVLSVQIIFNEFALRPSDRNLFKLSLMVTLSVVLIGLEIMLILSRYMFIEFKIKDIQVHKNSLIASAFEGIITLPDEQQTTNCIFT